jgi:pimeloyl-ACP methyl ester carboxylesterase
MPYVTNGDADIWYEDYGQGETVLLIHGGLFDHMNGELFWVRPGIVRDLVDAGYRVLIPDRRYCGGQTTAPFDVDTWYTEAGDMARVLRAADVPQAHIVAGSNGCSVAVRLVLDAPQRARSLVLCWPTSPDNAALREVFEQMATEIERLGTVEYVNRLRGSGVRAMEEEFTHFPWSIALLQDERLARTFRELPTDVAATIVRRTADEILSDGLLRGVSEEEVASLGSFGFPSVVIPPDPEDRVHTLAVATTLAGHIPGVGLSRGFPTSVSLEFRTARLAFTKVLQDIFRG